MKLEEVELNGRYRVPAMRSLGIEAQTVRVVERRGDAFVVVDERGEPLAVSVHASDLYLGEAT